MRKPFLHQSCLFFDFGLTPVGACWQDSENISLVVIPLEAIPLESGEFLAKIIPCYEEEWPIKNDQWHIDMLCGGFKVVHAKSKKLVAQVVPGDEYTLEICFGKNDVTWNNWAKRHIISCERGSIFSIASGIGRPKKQMKDWVEIQIYPGIGSLETRAST